MGEEKRLKDAVAISEAERRVRQLAVSFGGAVDAYRDYQIREGKEIERSRSLIENIEMLGYELTGKKAKFLNSATPARPRFATPPTEVNKSCSHVCFPLLSVTRSCRARAADAPQLPAAETQAAAAAPDSDAAAAPAKAPPKPRRTRTPSCLTVNRRFRYTDYPKGEIVPLLRMSGRWLEEHGFDIEGEVFVEASRAACGALFLGPLGRVVGAVFPWNTRSDF
jgi:hypothetical protein